MKMPSIKPIAIYLTALTLCTSMSGISTQASANEDKNAGTKAYSEKRNAADFWANFKQDANQNWEDSKAAFKDGWIESKLETALVLNEHLNAFKIDIQVENDMATLDGEVYSDVEKELAENIALGVEGIDKVTNNIQVVERPPKTPEPSSPQGRNFSQYVADVSTTAAIKTELLSSPSVQGTAINVDTLNHKVTLSGQVRSLEEKALAQAIAAKHQNVKGVINNLQVK